MKFGTRADRVLIMTSTVSPPQAAPELVRTDPEVRMRDYCAALEWYLTFLGTEIDRIVFVENSMSRLEPLHELVGRTSHVRDVEFLSFLGTDVPPAYGRCFGEAKILDFAMSNSRIVRAAPPSTHFWKITGRYRLINLALMFDSMPEGTDFYCDLRNNGSPWADMRLMGWTLAGYERMLKGIAEDLREDLNRGRPGEESLHRVLGNWPRSANTKLLFRRERLIDGVRAFDNQNWSEGRQRLVYMARDLQRRVPRHVFA